MLKDHFKTLAAKELERKNNKVIKMQHNGWYTLDIECLDENLWKLNKARQNWTLK